ncbi:hypothetical protein NE237_013357 [Protea cynaroides]|uniref:Uncharacterized protein n=1 Tax=Protea cynaroides TaxID=273540 RepID=A0A9Q0H3R0_9MAGN|nr:hypothetical protein NE237_013357 [Protea cynaroides]
MDEVELPLLAAGAVLKRWSCLFRFDWTLIPFVPENYSLGSNFLLYLAEFFSLVSRIQASTETYTSRVWDPTGSLPAKKKEIHHALHFAVLHRPDFRQIPQTTEFNAEELIHRSTALSEERRRTLETTNQGMEVDSGLVRLCIEAATESGSSVEKWRRQRRTLERLPTQLAEALLRRLLHRRLLLPSLLEVFKHCIEEIDLKGESSVNAEWMAYLGAFRYLRALNLAECQRINNSALWAITGMDSLQDLDLSGCKRVTDAGIAHLLSIPNLRKLCISGTCLSADAVTRLSSLINLTILDLGGLPVTDLALSSLQVLTKLEYLDLWGSKISNEGVSLLKIFTKLSFLNLAWTNVTKLPDLPSLECLNMSNCTISSVVEGAHNGVKVALRKLLFIGATLVDVHEVFFYIDASCLTFLDLSHSALHDFHFLVSMDALTHLDVSFSGMGDDSIALLARVGANLKHLNLSNTRLTSAGVEILVGHVPNLETLSLSHTAIDDIALSYISMIPSLRVVNLSNTAIKGFNYWVDDDLDQVPSLTALQNLNHLVWLDLEGTQIGDGAMSPLSNLRELNHLYLKGGNISDISLELLASIPKLKFLGICGAVLTNAGLNSFKPPAMLEMLDLKGCWLLTEDALSLFHKNHPQIEVKHEFAQGLFADQVVRERPSSLQVSSGSSQLKHKKGKISLTPRQFLKEIDERLKYSRAELLELQFSPLSCASPLGRGVVIPKMLTEHLAEREYGYLCLTWSSCYLVIRHDSVLTTMILSSLMLQTPLEEVSLTMDQKVARTKSVPIKKLFGVLS